MSAVKRAGTEVKIVRRSDGSLGWQQVSSEKRRLVRPGKIYGFSGPEIQEDEAYQVALKAIQKVLKESIGRHAQPTARKGGSQLRLTRSAKPRRRKTVTRELVVEE